MAELKTKRNDASVKGWLAAIPDPERRKDCETVIRVMKQATKAEPAMWGASIVGFGSYHYKYASGREGDWMLTGFASRKAELTLYIMSGFAGYDGLLAKLGKHRNGKSCLYLKRLSDIDMKVLKELVAVSVRHMKGKYLKGK
jgi:hypothetical protein